MSDERKVYGAEKLHNLIDAMEAPKHAEQYNDCLQRMINILMKVKKLQDHIKEFDFDDRFLEENSLESDLNYEIFLEGLLRCSTNDELKDVIKSCLEDYRIMNQDISFLIETTASAKDINYLKDKKFDLDGIIKQTSYLFYQVITNTKDGSYRRGS